MIRVLVTVADDAAFAEALLRFDETNVERVEGKPNQLIVAVPSASTGTEALLIVGNAFDGLETPRLEPYGDAPGDWAAAR
jgi:hypothetical protein